MTEVLLWAPIVMLGVLALRATSSYNDLAEQILGDDEDVVLGHRMASRLIGKSTRRIGEFLIGVGITIITFTATNGGGVATGVSTASTVTFMGLAMRFAPKAFTNGYLLSKHDHDSPIGPQLPKAQYDHEIGPALPYPDLRNSQSVLDWLDEGEIE